MSSARRHPVVVASSLPVIKGASKVCMGIQRFNSASVIPEYANDGRIYVNNHFGTPIKHESNTELLPVQDGGGVASQGSPHATTEQIHLSIVPEGAGMQVSKEQLSIDVSTDALTTGIASETSQPSIGPHGGHHMITRSKNGISKPKIYLAN
ncbi:hypothetical protein V6N13_114127 [Hibiscus sabdariffa]